jgi:hypothetical protein
LHQFFQQHQGEMTMIGIAPEAEYTPAQVAAVLNIPESLAQGLRQQWPVCGFDMIGYCHWHGIEYTNPTLAPESTFALAIRLARATSNNRTDQELFPVRDHFRRMMLDERERFAALICSLATATDTFSVSRIHIRVHYIFYFPSGRRVGHNQWPTPTFFSQSTTREYSPCLNDDPPVPSVT